MKKATILLVIAALAVAPLARPAAADPHGAGSARLQLVEANIPELQKAMQTKLLTAEQLVDLYLARIGAYDDAGPGVNAFLYVNPNAAAQARALDAGRHPGISRSPLYGIPVLLKDNIDTADMPTTAGSVALAGSIPPDDAFITRRLREAGAIILGKGTLTEFANFIALAMPTGYSSLGGFGFNPYDPRPLPAPVAPIANPFPSGVTFSGPAFSEPKLIGFAYAFEQATHYRVPPASTPPLPGDSVSRP